MATMLANIQQVYRELGIIAPNSVESSTDQIVVQMLALMNRVGTQLMKRFPWQAIQKEYRFYTVSSTDTGTTTSGSAIVTGLTDTSSLSTNYMVSGTGIPTDTFILSVDSSTQVTLSANATSSATSTLTFGQTLYSLPSDYDRIEGGTEWDKGQAWELLGPNTPKEWQFQKSGWISSGPRERFRIVGSQFSVWPMPSNGLRFGFEYISNNWCTDSSGSGKTAFTTDTDLSLLPDDLLILGTKARFYEAKGFDARAYQMEYMNAINLAKANDKGLDSINLSPGDSKYLIDSTNLPDTGYGA